MFGRHFKALNAALSCGHYMDISFCLLASQMYGFIQHGTQSVGPLKAIYMSPPGRPVHSNITRLLWEAFSNAAITVRRLFTHISTTVYSHILIYAVELTGTLWRERKYQNLKQQKTGLEPAQRLYIKTARMRWHSCLQYEELAKLLAKLNITVNIHLSDK